MFFLSSSPPQFDTDGDPTNGCEVSTCPNKEGFTKNTNACKCGTSDCTKPSTFCIATDNRCFPCDAGQVFQPNPEECLTCSVGQASSNISSSCAPCTAGKYQSEVAATKYGCTVCPAGQYNNNTNSTSCKLCPAGTKLTTAGTAEFHNTLSDCEDCPIFQFSPLVGHDKECYPCLTALVTGSIECAGCNPGRFKNETGDWYVLLFLLFFFFV